MKQGQSPLIPKQLVLNSGSASQNKDPQGQLLNTNSYQQSLHNVLHAYNLKANRQPKQVLSSIA